MSETETELTQIQAADLQKYIPESEMVKLAFQDVIGQPIEDWETAVRNLIEGTLDGDQQALFDLLELTYLSAHNEGMLEATDAS